MEVKGAKLLTEILKNDWWFERYGLGSDVKKFVAFIFLRGIKTLKEDVRELAMMDIDTYDPDDIPESTVKLHYDVRKLIKEMELP